MSYAQGIPYDESMREGREYMKERNYPSAAAAFADAALQPGLTGEQMVAAYQAIAECRLRMGRYAQAYAHVNKAMGIQHSMMRGEAVFDIELRKTSRQLMDLRDRITLEWHSPWRRRWARVWRFMRKQL